MLIAVTQIKLAISFVELKLEEIIPKDTENLLNFIDDVTAAASNGEKIRTVKNVNSSYSLITALQLEEQKHSSV